MRIQIELDKAGREQLFHLEEVTGLRKHTDFFNAAITLLDWAVRQRVGGRIIASMDESTETYKELQMPALEHAAHCARQEVVTASAAS